MVEEKFEFKLFTVFISIKHFNTTKQLLKYLYKFYF